MNEAAVNAQAQIPAIFRMIIIFGPVNGSIKEPFDLTLFVGDLRLKSPFLFKLILEWF
jgi:hypothetical protein